MADVPQDDLPDLVPASDLPSLKDKMAATDAALSLPVGTTQRQLTLESNLNPRAIGPITSNGDRAQGLAQIMPATQQALEARLGRKLDPFNTDDSLLMHRALMEENLQHFGNLWDALRAFNSGWNPSRWDNSETNNYVNKILTVPSSDLPTNNVPVNDLPDNTVPVSDLPNANPSWLESLKQTGKALYEVPAAMVTGITGSAAGIAAGAIPSLLEKYGLIPQGTGADISSKIQNSLAFQPSSPVAQTAMEGMNQLNPQNIPDWTERKLAELAGQPAPNQTGVGHQALSLMTNLMLGAKKPTEALQSIADTGKGVVPTSPEVVPQTPLKPSEPILGATDEAIQSVLPRESATQVPSSTSSAATLTSEITKNIPDQTTSTGILSGKRESGNLPTGENILNGSPTELIQHLDTALRQIETGLVESNYKRVPIAVTNDQAAALGYDPAAIMNKAFGEPLSAKEVQAVQNLSAAADAYRLNIAQRELAGDTTLKPDDLAKSIAMKNTIMDYLQQGVGEAARAMRQMQEAPKANSTLEANVKSMSDNFGDKTVRMKAAQAIVNVANDPVLSAQTARALAAPTAASKINQIIVNSFLTSPLTHEVSLVSHGTMPLSYLADQTVGAVLGLGDRSIAAILGREPPNVVSFGELGANYKGLVTGAIEGYKVYKKVWQTEALQALPSEANGRSFNAFGNSIGARLGNLPATEIMTHNQFFQAMVYRMALDGIAEREAWLSGLDPANKAMLAENIRQSPTEIQQAQAEATARDYSFARPLGDFGRAISRVSNSNPLVKANLPFIKIGINLGKQIVEHTPLALVSPRFYQDLQGIPAVRNAAIAKMIVGSEVLNQAWQAAQKGTLTGSAPTDPKLKAAWLALHPEKSYIGSDGNWHTHNELGVVSDILTLGANLAEVHDQWQKTRLIEGTIGTPKDQIVDKQFTEAFLGLGSGLYDAMLNKTFFRTLVNVVDLATAANVNDQRRAVGNYIAGLVPASPLLSFTTREADPILRRINDSVIDPLRARFPWVSTSMLPKISQVTGEPLLKNNPLVPVPQTTDKAIEEMVRLGVKLPLVPNHFTLNDGGDTLRPPMTPEENNYITQFRGQNAKATIDQIVNMPNWDKLPDQNKAGLITMVYDNFQKAAEQILTNKIAQENKERIILEVRRAMINTTKGQILLPEKLAP